MEYIIAPTNDDLMHSRGPWKKHKYKGKIGNKYIYDTAKTAGKMSDLGSSYIKKRKRINKRTAEDHKWVDTFYGKPISNPGNAYTRQVKKATEYNRRSDHEIVDHNDRVYKKRLNDKTKAKALKILKNSKLGKKIISKLKRKK